MWNAISTTLSLVPAALVWASAAVFTPDASIHDPRRIWQIETETPRNNLRSAMRDRGLAPDGSSETRAERGARDVVVRALLERVNEAYGRRPDGSAIRGRSVDVTFCASPPDETRFDPGPGRAYSRICVGGAQTTCGGTLGVQYLDYGNRAVEHECSPGRIGVFAGRICGLRSRLHPPLDASEARWVDGTYRLGDGSRADDERFLAVRAALEDWGTALGNVTAHEIGHAMGLDHDRGSGHVMQARISSDDLSSQALAMSPSSLRTLANDVGISASIPGGPREDAPGAADGTRRIERHTLESDRESTLGALALRATAIGIRDEAGLIAEVLLGTEAELRGSKLAGVPASGAGLVVALSEDQGSFVEGDVAAVRDAIASRVRGHLARLGGNPASKPEDGHRRSGAAPGARAREPGEAARRPDASQLLFLAEGLSSAVPRIAGDAALDLLSALEGPLGHTRGALAVRDESTRRSLAEAVADALARNAAALGDLRAPIRLAGRLGATGSVEEILRAVESEEGADLSHAAAEALGSLGGRGAIAHRVEALPRGPGRVRLLRALARMPAATIADLEVLLADEDGAVFESAARTLLHAGPVERDRLFSAARGLSPARRKTIEALRERPLP